jgi:glycosyltransferase involved in cell wall biosynthesis
MYANGCSDGTALEVTRFAQTHGNVHLCELLIASKPLAWNAAFVAHRSEFIIFSDGDILVDPGAALQLVNELKTFPKAVTRTRVIHVEHDYHFYEKQPHLLPRLGFLLRFAEAFVVVSDEIRDWFRSRLPEVANKCISIANGVDTARFRKDDTIRATLRRSHSIGEHDVVIGSCARLEPIKNLGFLLDCFAGYLGTVPDSWLVIVGDGSEQQALEKRSADLGIHTV